MALGSHEKAKTKKKKKEKSPSRFRAVLCLFVACKSSLRPDTDMSSDTG